MIRRWFALALGLAVAGCGEGSTGPRAPEQAPAVVAGSELPAAGAPDEAYAFGLKTRDFQLWLHAGEPPRYTVKATDGRVLARAIDAATLQRDYPELDHLLKNGVDASFEGGGLGLGYSDGER